MSRYWSCVVLGLSMLLSKAAAAETCRVCDHTISAKQVDLCLEETLKGDGCFEWQAACTSADEASVIGNPAANPFSVTCSSDQQKVTVALKNKAALEGLAGETITLTFGDNFKATAKVPEPEEPAEPQGGGKGESEGASSTKSKLLPIDIQPRNATTEELTPLRQKDLTKAKYVYVHENLAVDPSSAPFVTETDRIVIRFIARRALLCRYYAVSDEKNQYEPEPWRVGGREGLTALLEKSGKIGASATEAQYSCGVPGALEQKGTNGDGTPRYEPSGDGADYGYTDFTFGPFTSEQLTFHLFRHDGAFKGNDLQAVVKAANHERYTGWLDVSTVVSLLSSADQDVSVRPQNGSEVTRLHVSEERHQLDLVAQVKLFFYCNGEGNGWFTPQDLQQAAVCLGAGSGFSLLSPTRRFYPLGLNLTLAHYLSLNAFLTFQKASELGSGYAHGDIYTGSPDDITSNSRLVPGIAFGIGLDPTLLGEIVGAIIKAGVP